MNLRVASLLIVIGIFGFSSAVFAQKNKKTNTTAQPKAEVASTKTKKTAMTVGGKKAISADKVNKELKTKPGGGSSNRPASTGTALVDFDWIARSKKLTADTVEDIRGYIEKNGDNGGANGERAKDFGGSAFGDLNTLSTHYEEQNGNSGNPANYGNYEQIPGNSPDDIKARLEQALTFYDKIEFEHNGLKASAKNKLQQAIRQFQAYIDNLPAGVKKNQPTGEKVKGKGGSNLNGQPPAKPSTPKSKPKANSKTTKPNDNLFPLDDPWGKSPKKTKTKGSN